MLWRISPETRERNGLDKKMAAPVSSIIGHCPEGGSLCPNTSVMDCMEMLSKRIHRVLVPLDGNIENILGPELVESASAYTIMLTQMDLISFILPSPISMLFSPAPSPIHLSALSDTGLALTSQARVKDAIKCMSVAMLNAVPIVEASSDEEDHKQLVDGKNKRVVGTFSVSDLKGCHLATLRSWLPLNALEFVEKIPRTPLFAAAMSNTWDWEGARDMSRDVHLGPSDPYGHCEMCTQSWVVDHNDGLQGLLSLTDIIAALLSTAHHL